MSLAAAVSVPRITPPSLTFVPLHLERLAFEREGAGLRVVAGGLGGLYGHGIYLLFGCLDGRAVDDVVVA